MEYRDKDILREMLHFCEVRGEDSTGFFSVPVANNEATVHKVVGGTRSMFDTTAWDKLNLYSKRAVVGHCRKATIGGISRRTAHPFSYGSFVGVHNGTLRNWKALPGVSEDTDSMTLYDNFARVGVRETIEAVDGAYALVWWNEETGEINFLRNKERPLFYAFNEKGDKLLFASEAWMLTVAAGRNGLKLMDLTPKSEVFTSYESVPEDQWWRVRLGGAGDKPLSFLGSADGHDEELKGGTKKATYATTSSPFPYRTPFAWENDLDDDPNVDVKKDLPKPPLLAPPATTPSAAASAATSSSSTSSSSTEMTHNWQTSRHRKPTLSLVQTDKNVSSGASALGNQLVGYNGLMLNQAEYNEFVDPRCIWCKQEHSFLELRDGGKLGEWIEEDEYICSSCYKAADAEAC